jgi:hypothetical protein
MKLYDWISIAVPGAWSIYAKWCFRYLYAPVPEITLSQLSWLIAMTLAFLGVWWLTLYLDR